MKDQDINYLSSDEDDDDDLYKINDCFDLYGDLELTPQELKHIEMTKHRFLQPDDYFFEGGAKKANTGNTAGHDDNTNK